MRPLLVAGAAVSLALPLGRDAYGIAIQAAYTPRETITAVPSLNLINAGVSSSTAAYETGGAGPSGDGSVSAGSSSGSRHVSSENEGNGTTTRRHRRKTTEGASATGVAKNSGGTTKSKDYKERRGQPSGGFLPS